MLEDMTMIKKTFFDGRFPLPFRDGVARRWGSVSWPLVVAMFCLLGAWPLRAETGTPIPVAELDRREPVDFEEEILPILQKNCLACHNTVDADSDLILETPEAIRKGGSLGAAAVPGQGAESLLVLVAAHQDEPVMPPLDNDRGAAALTPDELGLIKKWIDEGGEGFVRGGKEPLKWQPIPPRFQPIFATAITEDGQHAACGRANRVYVYHLPSGRLATELVDPGFSSLEDVTASAAHRDLVQSLVFSPAGNRLASGGFRTVKLWRRAPNTSLSGRDIGAVSELVAMTSNHHWVASGEPSGIIRLLDPTGEHDVRLLEGHESAVTALTFSADGARLYSGGADKTVRVWKVKEGRQSAGFQVPAVVRSIALINEEKQLVTGGGDELIRAWSVPEVDPPATAAGEGRPEQDEAASGLDIKVATPLLEMGGHQSEVTVLISVPGATGQFFSGSLDGTVGQWDAAQGTLLKEFKHGAPVTAVSARPDGQRLVSVGKDHVARLWNTQEGNLVAELRGDQRIGAQIPRLDRLVELAKTEVGYQQGLLATTEKQTKEGEDALQKSGEALVMAEAEVAEKKKGAGELEEKKAAADQAVAAASTILEGLAGLEKLLQEYVAEGSENDQALLAQFQVILQAATNKFESKKGPAETLARQAEEAGAELKKAEETKRNAFAAENVASRELEQVKKARSEAEAALAVTEQGLKQDERRKADMVQAVEASLVRFTAVGFSHDSSFLVLADAERRLQLVDASTGKLFLVLDGHQAVSRLVSFTEATNLVSITADARMLTWNVQPQWVLERTIGDVDDPARLVDRVLALAFSPDGKLLATGGGQPSRSGQLRIWNVNDGQMVRSLDDAHSDTIFGLEFSPDGQAIASGAADRMVKTFAVDDGRLLRSFEGHTHHALDVDWQANGRRLATAGADNVIKVWDSETGVHQRTISGYPKEVTSVSFVGVGSQALATSGDSTIRLHDTDDGKEIRKFEGGGDFVYTAVANGAGDLMITGGRDSVLRVWNLKSGELQGSFLPPGPVQK
ncbi:MAG: hypothetical protein CMJ81_03225 [Planctomycetaceae bacterium]|nr:hypothetical protein [Planctomycetaceae bacterium]